MKAIIMAGGLGTRLRPVNSCRPKPMVNIFDRPILEHVILLLKRCGVSDMCVTVRHMADMITDRFGSGESLGVNIEYSLEKEALGTAGGVKQCASFIGGEDFLVISGDCICDLDLRALADFHSSRGGCASLALYACRDPLEYGSVVTGGDGRIVRFAEKPPWEKVVTDLVNTGIYVLSPSVLDDIPDGVPYDFGKDLFPALLAAGKPLYGLPLSGYWCDVGSCRSYLRCCIDALSGEVELKKDAPEVKNGVWSLSPLPDGAVLIPPVFVGRGVNIGQFARVGPCVSLGAGSSVESGASVRESVVDGAAIGKNASVSGAVVCRDASVGEGASVSEGAVIGEGCVIGADAVILPKVRLWPEQSIAPRARVKCSVTGGCARGPLRFRAGGVLSGEVGVDFTPEYCAALGSASSVWGRVGVGWGGGDAARVMASAMGCGVCAGGGELTEFDGGFRASAAYAGRCLGLGATAFFEERDGRMSVYFFSAAGIPIGRESERRLESLTDLPRAGARGVGTVSRVGGIFDSYCAAAARAGNLHGAGKPAGLRLFVSGRGTENRALRRALTLMGCDCSQRAEGAPVFSVSDGGLTLAAEDEDGHSMDWDLLLTAAALTEFERVSGTAAVPFDAPAAIDLLADALGAKVFRLGRDGAEAEALYASQIHMRDGVFAACRIVSFLAANGETLSSLRRRLPGFSRVTRYVPVDCGRAAAMRKLAAACAEYSAEFGSGIRMDTGRGWASAAPTGGSGIVRLRAEAGTEEIAEDICAEVERRLRDALRADKLE